MSARKNSRDPKADILLGEGTLNLSADKVRDPKFQQGEFFDPRDLVQVRYEMLRRVRMDNASVSDAADEYGISRPTYYHAEADFKGAGIAGLVPRKRGPHGPHKIQSEVLAFLEGQITSGQPMRARMLAAKVREKFGLDVHHRTIERALRVKKNAM
jgi:transposase